MWLQMSELSLVSSYPRHGLERMERDEYYAYQDRFGFWRTTDDSWTIPNETRVRNDFKTKQEAEDWIAKEKRNGINITSGSSNKVT